MQHLSVYRTKGLVSEASDVCFGNFNRSLPDDLSQDGIDDVEIVTLVGAYNRLVTQRTGNLIRVCNNGRNVMCT